MKKKFICTVCGYVHEGDAAPEKCPMCGVPASKFKELVDEGLSFVAEHEIGVAKGCDEEMIKDLNAHFNGECTEVGMYLAMSRQADAESGACADKTRIAKRAKELNLDAIHDTVHEMARDEARHGRGFEGLYNRYFKK